MKTHTLSISNCLLLFFAAALGGCASLSRGIAEAVLEAQNRETEDKRTCAVEGAAFTGLAPLLKRQSDLGPIASENAKRPSLKVVYVHGIGDHLPGHSANLVRSLANTLGLSVRARRVKRIVLAPSDGQARPYGEVNILRLKDSTRARELLFFEHTWSEITQREKQSIEFDNSAIFRSQRATINQRIRVFSNSALPDPIAFAGVRGPDIRGSVGQALCWALSAGWHDLPELTTDVRCEHSGLYGARLAIDDLVIITHSLGSRAAVDALQDAARYSSDLGSTNDDIKQQFTKQLRDTDVTLFMLSNQLPLLEAGQIPQIVTGQHATYCGDGAQRADERFLRRLNMIAVSDPNDVLSFPVPASWADQYLESRLCADIRNVTINIAHVRRLPVLGEFANPLEAHTGYDRDERVANLMAFGIGHAATARLVKERCTWKEVDPALD